MVSTETQSGVRQWTIDGAHATAEFRVRHLMISTVRGRFSGIVGTIAYDEANPAASHVEVEIPAAAIDTGNTDRDNHLRSPDFLQRRGVPDAALCEHTRRTDGCGPGHGARRPLDPGRGPAGRDRGRTDRSRRQPLGQGGGCVQRDGSHRPEGVGPDLERRIGGRRRARRRSGGDPLRSPSEPGRLKTTHRLARLVAVLS